MLLGLSVGFHGFQWCERAGDGPKLQILPPHARANRATSRLLIDAWSLVAADARATTWLPPSAGQSSSSSASGELGTSIQSRGGSSGSGGCTYSSGGGSGGCSDGGGGGGGGGRQHGASARKDAR